MKNKVYSNTLIIAISLFLSLILTGCKSDEEKLAEELDNMLNTTDESEQEEDLEEDPREFSQEIHSVFTIGDHTLITGEIEYGSVGVNDSIQILCSNGNVYVSEVKQISLGQDVVESAEEGSVVGLMLKDKFVVSEIEDCEVVTSNFDDQNSTEFEASITLNTSKYDSDILYAEENIIVVIGSVKSGGTLELIEEVDVVEGEVYQYKVTLNSGVYIETQNEFEIEVEGNVIGNGVVEEVLK